MTINGAAGETVTLSLKNFLMSGASTFTLTGTATTTFVINVTKQFSLTGNAKIVLVADTQWNNVIFNVRGKGSVTISGNSDLWGTINPHAPRRLAQGDLRSDVPKLNYSDSFRLAEQHASSFRPG